ncbi:hypothetical protein M2103_002359 [Ereboglobus sp. PH5-5]|nr:hypothetical protein [Ereboglobus sp. PH5-5]
MNKKREPLRVRVWERVGAELVLSVPGVLRRVVGGTDANRLHVNP